MIKKFINKHPQLWEIFKFLLVGGFATIVDFVAMGITMYFLAADAFGNSFLNVLLESNNKAITSQLAWWIPVLGTGIGFLFGVIFNYLCSVFFIFEKNEYAKTNTGKILFLVLSAVGLFIHLIGMYLGETIFEGNMWFVKVILTLVVLVFNYYTRKKFIFVEKVKKETAKQKEK